MRPIHGKCMTYYLKINHFIIVYKGSLTRSPSTENVTWIIMDNPSNCTNGFYDRLRKCVSNDKRSIKPLNGRKIYYNVNNNSKIKGIMVTN